MTAEDLQLLTEEALAATPGKAARVSLVIRQTQTSWAVLVVEGGEELALRVEVGPATTRDEVRAELERQSRVLF